MTRVALVTGGQQGIGLGIAEALSGAGFAVAIASERSDDDPAVMSGLARIAGGRHYTHDLADVSGAPALLDRVEADLGPITAFVQNAGVPARIRGDLLDIVPENFDFTLGVNLRGTFFLTQAVARSMALTVSHAYRSITIVTSVSAEMASPERGEYCISKAGASMMTRLFALRLAPLGIGVFEIRPGIIETGMTAGVKDKYTARIRDGLVPAGRWGQPTDIASIVVPIAEGRMAFASGAAIPVDGGLSIPRL